MNRFLNCNRLWCILYSSLIVTATIEFVRVAGKYHMYMKKKLLRTLHSRLIVISARCRNRDFFFIAKTYVCAEPWHVGRRLFVIITVCSLVFFSRRFHFFHDDGYYYNVIYFFIINFDETTCFKFVYYVLMFKYLHPYIKYIIIWVYHLHIGVLFYIIL